MNRDSRARQGQETVTIIESGGYTSRSGRRVDLRAALTSSVEASRLYLPQDSLPEPSAGLVATEFTVANETTLRGASEFVARGHRVLALNFASAKNPGGGFLSGAQAQEESIARASGLYACLVGSPYYAHHRAEADAFYSHRAIYSPDVPVFRGEDGALLDEPWLCSFITCPAVNRGALVQHRSTRLDEIREVMCQRIERILLIAAAHGHDALVLGAFGCGVFRNDPVEVAELFQHALTGRFRGVYQRVHFAVLDRDEGACINAFHAAFGGSSVAASRA